MPYPTPREASFNDYSQIVALESKYGLETKPYEEWQDLWVSNPAYKEHREDLPIGWVLEDEEENIVGYLGNIPLHYEFEGRRLLASVAHSWVVDSRYRSYAVMLLGLYFSQSIVDLFLNATVGPAASDAFATFESAPVPAGTWDRSLFCITNYRGFLAGSMAMKRIPLAAPLTYILSLGPKDRHAVSKSTRPSASAGCSLDVCTAVGDRFNEFWGELRRANPQLLLGVRTREVLDWHFKYALQNNRAWIVTASEGSRIVAYGIFRRYDNARVGLKRMRLVDFQTLNGNIGIVTSMLHWARQRCRDEGIHMLESIGFRAEKQNLIRNIARRERQLPSWLYFYHAKDKELSEKLMNPNAWDPSQFDGDASL